MFWYWLLFFFIAFGAKLLLALVMIYMLLPADVRCDECDHETLRVGARFAGRIGGLLTFGLVQWRWCPSCGWEGLARRLPPAREPAGKELGAKVHSRQLP